MHIKALLIINKILSVRLCNLDSIQFNQLTPNSYWLIHLHNNKKILPFITLDNEINSRSNPPSLLYNELPFCVTMILSINGIYAKLAGMKNPQ